MIVLAFVSGHRSIDFLIFLSVTLKMEKATHAQTYAHIHTQGQHTSLTLLISLLFQTTFFENNEHFFHAVFRTRISLEPLVAKSHGLPCMCEMPLAISATALIKFYNILYQCC